MDDSELRALLHRISEKIAQATSLLSAKLDTLDERVSWLEGMVLDLAKALEKIVEQLEAIREDLAAEARRTVAAVLRDAGFGSVELTSITVEGYRFDIYGRLEDDSTIVGRSYVTAGDREVEKLVSDIEAARRLRPELFQGKIVPVIYALRFSSQPPPDIIVVTPHRVHVPKRVKG